MKQDRFELGMPIGGKNPMAYMAELLERNDKAQIEIERGKLYVAILKQMNNRSRLLLDAAKYELKNFDITEETELLVEELKRVRQMTTLSNVTSSVSAR